MELTENQRKRLQHILDCRKQNSKNMRTLTWFAIPFYIGVAFVPFLYIVGLVFGAAACILMFYSITKTAKVSCPNCGNAFGSSWPVALGVGANNCQSCDLSLNYANPDFKHCDQEWRQ